MEPRNDLPSDAELLEQINVQLGDLGQTTRYKRLPEVPAVCTALHQRMLVMVDDTPKVLAAYLPHLIAATRGRAAAVLHQEQNIEQLIDEALAHDPEQSSWTISLQRICAEIVSCNSSKNALAALFPASVSALWHPPHATSHV